MACDQDEAQASRFAVRRFEDGGAVIFDRSSRATHSLDAEALRIHDAVVTGARELPALCEALGVAEAEHERRDVIARSLARLREIGLVPRTP